jgi:hypothetical protein
MNRIGRSVVLAAALAIVGVGAAAAHEERELGDYSVEVGFRNEPVFTGEESGLEFFVNRGDEPVEGLEDTIQAQVTFGAETRDLEVTATFGQPGAYQAIFFPTAAGQYTFRIYGSIEDLDVDEEFTSGPDTFGDVRDVTSGQFPIQFPATADIVRDAEAGANAATMAIAALVVGGLGLLAGLIALGLVVARRRA